MRWLTTPLRTALWRDSRDTVRQRTNPGLPGAAWPWSRTDLGYRSLRLGDHPAGRSYSSARRAGQRLGPGDRHAEVRPYGAGPSDTDLVAVNGRQHPVRHETCSNTFAVHCAAAMTRPSRCGPSATSTTMRRPRWAMPWWPAAAPTEFGRGHLDPKTASTCLNLGGRGRYRTADHWCVKVP